MQDVPVAIDGGFLNVWHRAPAADSPTAVLVHGLTGTSRWWTPVLSHLPEEMGLIIPDIRGRGQSWQSPGPYDLKTVADDIATCLDHFEVPAAVVAGYSMGAWVATLFAQRRPGRARHLILVDGGFPIQFDPGSSPEEILEQVVGPAVARLSVEFATPHAYLDFWRDHPALVGRWDEALAEVLNYDIRKSGDVWRVRANRDAIVAGGSDFALDPETVASGISTATPTTLLVVDHGMTDRPGGFTPLSTAREAADSNPNIEVRLLEGLNHYTLMFGAGAAIVASIIASHG